MGDKVWMKLCLTEAEDIGMDLWVRAFETPVDGSSGTDAPRGRLVDAALVETEVFIQFPKVRKRCETRLR